jgi:hypothetical protein
MCREPISRSSSLTRTGDPHHDGPFAGLVMAALAPGTIGLVPGASVYAQVVADYTGRALCKPQVAQVTGERQGRKYPGLGIGR